MKIIGITGGTGAGKSVLSKELERRGCKVVDADKVSRKITASDGAAFDEIIENFGKEILDDNGEINRKALGKIVFENPKKLELLNKITHKHIFDEMQRELEVCDSSIAVLDVPLLFQCDFPIKCDLTVAVTAPDELRIKRIMERDGITEDTARARMKAQLSNEEYKKLADICFENSGGLQEVRRFAEELCREI